MKKSLIPLLVLSTLLPSCSSSSSGATSFSTWTTYSTAKVIQEATRNEDFVNTGKTVKISMMREENESSQLIVTSKSKATYDLTKTDLVDTSTGNIIPSDNITVYVEKYCPLTYNTHSSTVKYFNGGESIPDCLIPIEYIKNANENVVEANKNQGFLIEVDSSNLKAGNYKGTFKLTMNNKSEDIPIEVKIWDIAYEGKSQFQSCWLIYSMYMFTGEYDASEEMIDTYADFLASYKACPYVIQEKAMNSPSAFIEDVERLWQIKNYNTIIIPFDFPLTYTADSADGTLAASYIVELAKHSTEENFYLDYAAFYPSTYDEADVIESKKVACDDFFKSGGNYEKTLEKAISMLESDNYFASHDSAWNERVKKAIRAIPDIFTNVNLTKDWTEEYPATFCPKAYIFNSHANVDFYQDYAALHDKTVWTYTCCDPTYPYPSNHLDDDDLSMRVLGWMEKSYDVSGYLFFMANMYGVERTDAEYYDVYSTPMRNNTNGDGFIMYPGRKYGSSTPFPSMRLITYRDGLEDYDMLSLYEQKINAYAAKYNLDDIDASNFVQDLYDSLFTGAINNEDHNLLFEAREELAQRILALDNEDDLFSYVSNDGNSKLNIYTTSPTLNINGQYTKGKEVAGGYYYYFDVSSQSNRYDITSANNIRHVINTSGYEVISTYSEDKTTVSSNGASTFSINENNQIEATLICECKDKNGKIGTQTFIHRPSISLENIDLTGAKRLTFIYTNTGLETLEFNVNFVTDNKKSLLGESCFCLSGRTKTVSIDLTKLNEDLASINKMSFSFSNYGFDDDGNTYLLPDRNISIDKIYIEK